MAKFNLSGTGVSLTFNSVGLTCLQTVTVSGTAPNTEIECSGATSVENVAGLPRYSMSGSGALETDDTALVNAIFPGENGAITFYPASTTAADILVTSSNGIVTDFSMTTPVNGFSQYSFTLVLDDLTIAAIPA